MEDGLRSRQKKFDDDLSLATETLATFHDSGDPEKVCPSTTTHPISPALSSSSLSLSSLEFRDAKVYEL